jgi:hypothetical protein
MISVQGDEIFQRPDEQICKGLSAIVIIKIIIVMGGIMVRCVDCGAPHRLSEVREGYLANVEVNQSRRTEKLYIIGWGYEFERKNYFG